MFRIKICGITRASDACIASQAGADAIGLNFYPASPRHITPAQARLIAEAIPGHVRKIGVFVNASVEEILSIAREIPLDAIQLHGDEPPEIVARLSPLPVIRAFRIAADENGIVTRFLQSATVAGVLIDAFSRDAYGGTGKTADWTLLPRLRSSGVSVPLLLAGGLTPLNLADALAISHPDGIDTASGVETSPGIKDAQKVKDFVRIARAFFEC